MIIIINVKQEDLKLLLINILLVIMCLRHKRNKEKLLQLIKLKILRLHQYKMEFIYHRSKDKLNFHKPINTLNRTCKIVNVLFLKIAAK